MEHQTGEHGGFQRWRKLVFRLAALLLLLLFALQGYLLLKVLLE
ncbi:MAG: hypothetical protein ACE5MH_05995 [Terriglobia bacterium]